MAASGARLVLVLASAWVLHPANGFAQSAVAAPTGTCDGLATATRIWESNDVTTIEAVTRCLTELRAEVPVVNAMPAGPERTRRLIDLRARFKRYTGWLPDRESKTPKEAWNEKWLLAAEEKRQARRDLYTVLNASKLYSKFSAVLISAVALVDTNESSTKGTAAGSSAPAAGAPAAAVAGTPLAGGSESSAAGLGNIVWQSRHVGDSTIRPWGLELSAGGRIGMQPVLNLVAPEPAATSTGAGGSSAATPGSATATPTAVHQNAFVWTAGLQIHMPVSQLDSEFALFGTLGSALLTTAPKVLGSGKNAQLALPLDAGTRNNAWRWESGIQFSVFDNELDQIHAEGGMLTPQLQAAVAWRRDQRFAGLSSFTSPTDRLIFRFALDAIRVLDKRQLGDDPKTFTFGFAVEREQGFGKSPLPPATRYMLRGDVNILNAVANAGSGKSADVPATVWTAALSGSPQLALATKPTRVTVVLRGLKGSQNDSVTPSPAPTIDVGDEKSGVFALPTCPGASIRLALKAGLLTLTTEGWGSCQAKTVELAVTPK